jgi:Uma2 family endonuclease
MVRVPGCEPGDTGSTPVVLPLNSAIYWFQIMPAALNSPTSARLRFPFAEGLELRLRPGIDIATRAGFDALCEDNPDLRIERKCNGELTIDMPTKGFTGMYNALLAILLGNWALQNGEGFSCDSSTGFTLPDGSVLSPDASWVRKTDVDALTDSEREDYMPVVPEFIVEIRSKSDRLSVVREKMEAWRDNGVSLGVLIDPITKNVEVYRTGTTAIVLENPEGIDCSPELPDFVLNTRAIFDIAI